MSNNKKRNIIIGSLCAVVLLMAVGYAAFQTVLNIQGTSNITSSWGIKITNITSKNIVGTASNNGAPTFADLTATFKTNLQTPGDSIEYDITVSNEGTLNAKLDEITLSNTNNPAIKFTSSGMTKGDIITAGSTKILTVKVEYLASVTMQPENTSSTLTVDLDYSQATNATPSEERAADKLIATSVTTGDGLYADNYEEGRYVYKGANPANYITFNNEEWRIMAVEADGTLKVIKNADIGARAFDSQGYRDSTSNGAGGTYCAQSSRGCNAWAKSDNFVSGSFSGTVLKDASLNTYLNSDYYNALSDDAKSQIQSHNFGIGATTYDNSDLAVQIASENSITWNGNIGLMSVSDYLRANTNIEKCGNFRLNNTNVATCNTTDYLFNKTQWTISPDSSDRTFRVFYLNSGSVSHVYTRFTGYVVGPVLYLKPDITLSGEGTPENPYIVA